MSLRNENVIQIRSSKLLQKRVQEALKKAPVRPPIPVKPKLGLSASDLEIQELRLMVLKLVEIQQELVERMEENEKNFLRLLQGLKASSDALKARKEKENP